MHTMLQRLKSLSLPLLLFSIILISTSCSFVGSEPLSNTTTQMSINPPLPNFSPFAGTWYGHGRELMFQASGQATYQARTYTWCATGVTVPCDSMQDNMIHAGIVEYILFTSVQNKTASGHITSSTTNNTGQAITVTLQANDTLTFANGLPLCGSHAPAGWCGA